ncbi:MAG: class I SAM-dependent methyltransferase [Actinomycetes bacterium]
MPEEGQSDQTPPTVAAVTRRPSDDTESRRANQTWWDHSSGSYQAAHATALGDAEFLWAPEGLTEADTGLLGDVTGRVVLEVGCGAAQCGRWLVRQGARVVGVDLSRSQLSHARELDARTGVHVPTVQADALRLPLRDASFDLACSAFGAVPFVADSAGVMREVARVLRPGGRWVFSVAHPFRWALPDDGGPAGLVVTDSYFDRTPYVEEDDDGDAVYVAHHRTIGDRVREIVAAGFQLIDILEPEWPADRHEEWDSWTPLRGRLIPGTAIFVCGKPD